MKGLIFLPGRSGSERLSIGTGLCRMDDSASHALKDIAARMAVREEAVTEEEITCWRGALSLALLADTWADGNAQLEVITIDRDTSPFAARLMQARPAQDRDKPIHLVLLKDDTSRCLLGVTDDQIGLKPAASPDDLTDLLPPRMGWYDKGHFADPVPLLNERDRALLIRRLHLMNLPDPRVKDFVSDLAQQSLKESQPITRSDDTALRCLAVMLKATIGFSGEENFPLEERDEPYRAMAENPFLSCFVKDFTVPDEGFAPQKTYLWNGVPFARSSTAAGLTVTGHPRCYQALLEAEKEVHLLENHSSRWCQDAARRIEKHLQRMEGRKGFLPGARAVAEGAVDGLRSRAREDRLPVITFPLTPGPASRLIFRESLGFSLTEPFTPRLTRLLGGADALGDAMLQDACRQGEDAFLPPLSDELSGWIHRQNGLFSASEMYFVPGEDGEITFTLLLHGQKDMALARTYPAEDIREMASLPAVAVWPCLPLKDASWRAYFVYLRGENIALHLPGGENTPALCPASGGFSALQTEEYPACITLWQEEECLGAIPNVLPAADPLPSGDAIAAIDFGACGISVMLRQGEITSAPEDVNLLRLLLCKDAPDLAAEFTTGDFSGVWPTCALLTGEDCRPLLDGRMYAPETLPEAASVPYQLLSGSLKWRSDDAALRGREALMHQVMLHTACVLRLRGAASVTWRISLPDRAGKAQQSTWLSLMDRLAHQVAKETGLPLTRSIPAVTWAAEGDALHACLRLSHPVGAMASLDVGGGSMDIRLWLDGSAQPQRRALLSGGLQTLLLSALSRHPDWLTDACPSGDAARDAQLVTHQAEIAATGLPQMERALFLTDLFMARHGDALSLELNRQYALGRILPLQALLMETFCALMCVTGMGLAQLSETPDTAHQLPEHLPLHLSGRGAMLLGAMPPQLQQMTLQFLYMMLPPEYPTRRVSLRLSGDPKGDIARGLCRLDTLPDLPRDLPACEKITTAESFSFLVMTFLKVFRIHGGAAAEMLHPGLMDMAGQFTPSGEEKVRRICAKHYHQGEDIPSALMWVLSDLR
ncbi:MAG: hypothetical protein E7333_04215 [Clostridiales bacterium]|nr:hypothetical protein [Clostridiales bacterium]